MTRLADLPAHARATARALLAKERGETGAHRPVAPRSGRGRGKTPPRPIGPQAGSQGPDTPRGISFATCCTAVGIPEPTPEYRFHPTRRWRFDYAWPAHRVALEVEGSVPGVGGRHRSYDGWRADMAKYNAAAQLGWRLVRCTPGTLATEETLDALRQALFPTLTPDQP